MLFRLLPMGVSRAKVSEGMLPYLRSPVAVSTSTTLQQTTAFCSWCAGVSVYDLFFDFFSIFQQTIAFCSLRAGVTVYDFLFYFCVFFSARPFPFAACVLVRV